ncbi:TetR/AcrR family transcriptional regulator [Nocardia sp. NPDC051756]|uniref:TetR/AcrR family transcriptional regulator n=1 Tax=Nocardia sp. NPDC051756 TaxID=3154751 RepID=UPI00344428C5
MQQQPAEEPRRRASRNSLNPAVIVTATLALLSDQGLEAFSMRSLAARLDVRPMALYTHFRSKDELFDAVRDQLLELTPPTTTGGWEDQIRAIAHRLRAQMLQHPFLITLMLTRPLSGRETADSAELILRALRDAGFDRETTTRAHVTLLTHVLGATSWETQWAAHHPDPGQPSMFDVLPRSRYPTLTELEPEMRSTAGGPAQFEFGLDLLLDGLRHKLPAS